MKIGFVGLGKLGLPVALAVENKGHKVIGYDISNKVKSFIKLKKIPYREVEAPKLLKKSKLELVEIKETDDIFAKPEHDYTIELLRAIPKPDPEGREERKKSRLGL